MRNSDDAKLIAGAIEKAGRLISEAIKDHTRQIMYRTQEFITPEMYSESFAVRRGRVDQTSGRQDGMPTPEACDE